jgi:hypothetical protein
LSACLYIKCAMHFGSTNEWTLKNGTPIWLLFQKRAISLPCSLLPHKVSNEESPGSRRANVHPFAEC